MLKEGLGVGLKGFCWQFSPMTKKAFKYELGEDFALRMDADGSSRRLQEQILPYPGSIYMDGNSLGLMSRDAEETLLRVANEWKTLGIAGWGKGKIPWIDYGENLGDLEAPARWRGARGGRRH